MSHWTLRTILARIQDTQSPNLDKWENLIHLAMCALDTAACTLQDMVAHAQTDEEFTAFSRFVSLAQCNEVFFFVFCNLCVCVCFQKTFFVVLDCKRIAGLCHCT